ncbi:MAG: ABC transporter permease [Anaerolineae bacterium]|nr:ABC transporter permease [Anaerolineae bacterium]
MLILYADEESARDALNADDVDVFYVIQADYLESGEVVLHLPNLALRLITSGPIEQLFYSTLAVDLDALTIRRLRNPMVLEEFNLEEDASESNTGTSEGVQFGIVYAFAIFFFIGLMMTNTYLMQSVIQERESRLIEILISTMHPTQLLTGKILAFGLLGLMQLLAWGISTALIIYTASQLSTYSSFISALSLDISWSIIPIMLIYFVLMYMTFAAIFGGIGAISGSAQEGQQYMSIMVMPIIFTTYAFPLIQANPNGALAVGLSMFPITSGVAMLMRSIISTVPVWQLALSMGIMVVAMMGAMWLSGRLFRVQTLLAGSFKLKDIPKLLFQDVVPHQAKESA